MEYDILIADGTVIDGTGKKGFAADVLIKGDKIIDVGYFPEAKAKKVIDAKALIVSPGFIDCHTHLEFFMSSPRHARKMERWARQGVTTIVGGNCGWSPAPLMADRREMVDRYWNFALPREGMSYDWETMGDYLGCLERNGIAYNLGVLTGHNVLRINAMGFDEHFAAPRQIEVMKRQLRDSMEAGSLGLSLGLFYCPAFFSHTNELKELASVLTDYNGVLVPHTRGLSETYDDAVAEVIDVAETAGIPLQLSHHAGGSKTSWIDSSALSTRISLFFLSVLGQKTVVKGLKKGTPVRNRSLKLIKEARERGVSIGCDNMPWLCGPSTVLALLPPWMFAGGFEAFFQRLKAPDVRRKAIKEMKTKVPVWPTWNNGWWTDNYFNPGVRISGFRTEKNLGYENRTIKRIAKDRKSDPHNTLFDLIEEENGRLFFIDGVGDSIVGDWIMAEYLTDAHCSVMTDAVGVDFSTPNPVSWGAFTKVLGTFARERKILSLEEAVRKMTSLPAEQMGLQNRGVVRKGAYADITVFDGAEIKNRASFKHPERMAEGVTHVLINGVPVVDDASFNEDCRAGRILRR